MMVRDFLGYFASPNPSPLFYYAEGKRV